MPASFTTQDRVALARRFRERGIPGGQEFIQDWVSFNTCYNTVEGRRERDRLTDIVRQCISPDEAIRLLDDLAEHIAFFTLLPPGNDRKAPHDPDFRRQSTQDLEVVNDLAATPPERLAHLMSVVYTVRCNLVHGDKDPDLERDRDLVRHSRVVLEEVLSSMLAVMG